MFRVLAAEDKEAVVLNYAPGPLDTPMIENLLADARTVPGKTIDPRPVTPILFFSRPHNVRGSEKGRRAPQARRLRHPPSRSAPAEEFQVRRPRRLL